MRRQTPFQRGLGLFRTPLSERIWALPEMEFLLVLLLEPLAHNPFPSGANVPETDAFLLFGIMICMVAFGHWPQIVPVPDVLKHLHMERCLLQQVPRQEAAEPRFLPTEYRSQDGVVMLFEVRARGPTW